MKKFLMVMVSLSALCIPAAFAAEENYECTCMGIPKYFLWWEVGRRNCGNGFMGGNVGLKYPNPITKEDLHKFLPYTDFKKATLGTESVYSSLSGWECKKQ